MSNVLLRQPTCLILAGVDPKSEAVYFLGNSLGLQPKIAQEMVKTEMDKWAKTCSSSSTHTPSHARKLTHFHSSLVGCMVTSPRMTHGTVWKMW